MNSSKVKALVIVSVLLLITGIVAVGCKKQQPKTGWVNTGSMPGQGVHHYIKSVNTPQNNSSIVYLGPKRNDSNVNFGPSEISFDFKDLK